MKNSPAFSQAGSGTPSEQTEPWACQAGVALDLSLPSPHPTPCLETNPSPPSGARQDCICATENVGDPRSLECASLKSIVQGVLSLLGSSLGTHCRYSQFCRHMTCAPENPGAIKGSASANPRANGENGLRAQRSKAFTGTH